MRPYDIGFTVHEKPFLEAVERCADAFVAEADRSAGDLLDGYFAYAGAGGASLARSRGEHAIELLTFGLLRREMGPLAAATTDRTMERLEELWSLRSQDPERKATADAERGELFRHLLYESEMFHGAQTDDARLVRWLAATGEFVQEALRMGPWLSNGGVFWSPEEFRAQTEALAEWFTHEAATRLGPWTSGVDTFRQGVLGQPDPREDLLLITRSAPLYHLNMVGAVVMNRGFLSGFVQRPRKVVLVPGCLRTHNDRTCQAKHDGLDISCTRCDPDCEVAALDRLAKSHGFRVFVVPHASTFTAWLKHWQSDPETSLVAVACPLHLVPGGYEMRALGLHAQCVMLDYSGCKRHWDSVGVPTRLDRDQLLAVVAARVSSDPASPLPPRS